MNPPLVFHLMARSYNCYGVEETLPLIPDFLLMDAPAFGPALAELTVTLHFPSSERPPSSLWQTYAEFQAARRTLPKVVFQPSRQTAAIDVASELLDGKEWRRRRGLSPDLFRAGLDETIAALELLKGRLTARDDFRLDAFLKHCEDCRPLAPATEDELAALKDQISIREAAIWQAMTPWERLGIDWRDYHPDARTILDDPFFWSQADEESPHGNDTGADLLVGYRKWLQQHPDTDPVEFYEQLVRGWRLPPEYDPVLDQAAVALAFAELKLRGACRPSAAELARNALERQRQAAMNAPDRPPGAGRLALLELIEAKLRAAV